MALQLMPIRLWMFESVRVVQHIHHRLFAGEDSHNDKASHQQASIITTTTRRGVKCAVN